MLITINGQKVSAEKNQTILEVASANNIFIPRLCYHSDIQIQGSCRLCLVKIKGSDKLYSACSTPVLENMEVVTSDPDIIRARRINLELIFTEHCEECSDCIRKNNCIIKNLAKNKEVKITRFPDRKKNFPSFNFHNVLEFDSSKCVDCGLCVDMCHQMGVDFLEYKKVKDFWQVMPSSKKNHDCIYCGQCLVHCPVGAFEGNGEFEDVLKPFTDKNKIVVFQIAPSIRVTIGEEFGMSYGSIVTEKIAAALHKAGADYVFDVSVGADLTTMEEAKELADRLKSGKNLPMFTSCCPAWVKYVEFFRPDLIPHLTTARSPHLMLAGIIKTHWAKAKKLDPKNITVVSIVPCVSKKYDLQRPEFKIKGIHPIDYVMTTRELAELFRRQKIDFKNIKPRALDNPLGIPSSAGVIYGASGGVMESALRTAYHLMTGSDMPKLEFEAVRGLAGFKTAKIKIGKKNVRLAVINGLKSIEKVNLKDYDYIEMMACLGGCIGGGGQPVPVNAEIRKKRAQALYQIDDRSSLRTAHASPIIQKLYKEFLNNHKIIHQVCHSRFFKKAKEVNY